MSEILSMPDLGQSCGKPCAHGLTLNALQSPEREEGGDIARSVYTYFYFFISSFPSALSISLYPTLKSLTNRSSVALTLLSATSKEYLKIQKEKYRAYKDVTKLAVHIQSARVLKTGQESNFQFTVEWEMLPFLEDLKQYLHSGWKRWLCVSVYTTCVCARVQDPLVRKV